MKREILFGLILLFFSGCALFKSSIHDELLPMEMTEVPGGAFLMGDIFNEENEDAIPIHEVTLPDFEIGTYEVTYEQYDAFAKATERELPKDDGRGRGRRAVVNIDWFDAREFCRAYGYDLPTEQQWEYAARSGGKEQVVAGTNDSSEFEDYARFSGNSGTFSFWVGSKKPNDLGLYDMSGNVAEWIGEWYSFYKAESDSIEYYPLEERDMRVIRGGSFRHPVHISHTYYRVGFLADSKSSNVGFRCASRIEES